MRMPYYDNCHSIDYVTSQQVSPYTSIPKNGNALLLFLNPFTSYYLLAFRYFNQILCRNSYSNQKTKSPYWRFKRQALKWERLVDSWGQMTHSQTLAHNRKCFERCQQVRGARARHVCPPGQVFACFRVFAFR